MNANYKPQRKLKSHIWFCSSASIWTSFDSFLHFAVIHATEFKLYELKTVWQSSILWNSVAGRRLRSLWSDQCHDMQTCLTAEFRLFHVVAYILITLKSTVLERKCQIDCIMEAKGILQIFRTFWGETTINEGNVGWRKDSGIITNSVIKKKCKQPLLHDHCPRQYRFTRNPKVKLLS